MHSYTVPHTYLPSALDYQLAEERLAVKLQSELIQNDLPLGNDYFFQSPPFDSVDCVVCTYRVYIPSGTTNKDSTVEKHKL